eukprot:COSAG05_NODE_801_length_7224_cov_4.552000_13_plen_172_part_00
MVFLWWCRCEVSLAAEGDGEGHAGAAREPAGDAGRLGAQGGAGESPFHSSHNARLSLSFLSLNPNPTIADLSFHPRSCLLRPAPVLTAIVHGGWIWQVERAGGVAPVPAPEVDPFEDDGDNPFGDEIVDVPAVSSSGGGRSQVLNNSAPSYTHTHTRTHATRTDSIDTNPV